MLTFADLLTENSYLMRLIALLKKVHHALNFERRFNRKTKIALGLLVFAMWLSTPLVMKFVFISTHCINCGLGLLLHTLVRHWKYAPHKRMNLANGNPFTMLLGAALVCSGVAIRCGLHWHLLG